MNAAVLATEWSLPMESSRPKFDDAAAGGIVSLLLDCETKQRVDRPKMTDRDPRLVRCGLLRGVLALSSCLSLGFGVGCWLGKPR